jgi:ABC-type transporter Mla subunit MlaD
MPTLENVTGEVVVKLTTNENPLEEVSAGLQTCTTDVQEHAAQFRNEWEQLESQAEAASQRTAAAREKQSQAFQGLLALIGVINSQVGGLKSGLEQAVAAARQEIENTSQQLIQLWQQVDQAGDEVDTMLKSLEQACSDGVTKVTDATFAVDAAMAAATNMLDDRSEFIRRVTDELEQFVSDECVAKLKKQADAFEDKMEDLTEQLSDKLEDARDHAEETASTLISGAKDACEDKIDGICDALENFQEDMEDIAEAIEKILNTFERTKDNVDQALKLTTSGFSTASNTLKEVEKLLQKFQL